ncbi:uroporphyrinogen-III synthase [Rubinisphaera sp.]|uniref:uroporphyrinogen-III synthase n=1 Tax=Rubinisphaera sp. TaxID=2024857 RepID=UPI000C0E8348|nr:uroporphyrinogen-III synthase [Rubinisphaera sp.]MBV10781.1 uroporphyrinogen III synthase [Rubinisphaera sp.]HCS55191.1 uroporphyrinogen III synthase [Planctomycetaceae bacterium]|tara:strand:- start:7978 stop:8796 length:819 start_codon:yes stop_codon:yes gene_type:complete
MSVRVCSFESRRCQEMATLIAKFGGEPTVAPSMREVPLEENTHAINFAERIIQGEINTVLFMTGVGARTLFEAIQKQRDWKSFHQELDRRVIIVRGPKPVPVLKEAKIHIDYRAPEPNTWREILEMLDNESISLQNQEIAVQEYGRPNLEFYSGLEQRGAKVYPVPVYLWDFPEDVEPLYEAVRLAVNNPFDLVMFTSANQVDNVLEAAETIGMRENLLNALKQSTIASIGPTCSDRLREFGIPVAMEPSHPKMAHLIREAIELVQNNQTEP